MRTIDKLIDQCNAYGSDPLNKVMISDLQMHLDNEGIEITVNPYPFGHQTDTTVVLLAMVLNLTKRVEELERGNRE